MEEKAKVPVSFRRTALRSVSEIAGYIEEKGSVYQARQYAKRLHAFGVSLGNFPMKYATCRNLVLAKLELRCATFDKMYVFVYGVSDAGVEIFAVINGATLS